MMRAFYKMATALFWFAVLIIWGWATWHPAEPVTARPAEQVAVERIGSAQTVSYTAAEVARHAGPEDCWMIIDGRVYDITAYLPDHPSRSGIVEPWCGKEASESYHTKGRGRPHSAGADALLAECLVGTLKIPE